MVTRKNAPRAQPKVRSFSKLFAVAGMLTLATGIGVVVGGSQNENSELQKPEPILVGKFETEDVFVPIRPVPQGVRLADVHFRPVKYPAHQLPQGAIKDPNDFLSHYTVVAIPAGVPVSLENISPVKLGSNPVAEKIPDGMRAMTVKVDPTSLVNGWAGPGSLVDLALLTPERSQVIAEKIKVLSTEKFVSQVDGAPAEGLPSTATLLVDQQQALAISAAMPQGKLIFLLRNAGDAGSWVDKYLEASRLAQGTGNSKSFKGYIAVKEGAAYALEDSGWVPVRSMPQGTLVGR